MKLLRKFAIALGITSSAVSTSASTPRGLEQAVIVHFNYGSTSLEPLFRLEKRLEKAIAAAKAGEYDGNEVATDGHDGYLYMYGPDADRLYQAVAPVLKAESFMKGATVKKRYGPPQDGVKEIVLTITP